MLTPEGIIMRIAVLGASGRTGALVVDAARSRGHEPVAVVRRPGSAPDGAEERLADGRDADALAEALAGCDAVVFAIGPSLGSSDHTVMRESMPAVVDAMRRRGITRLATVSASGPYSEGDDPFLRYVAKPIVRRILREPFADLAATETVVRASGLDWTIVRPPQLQDGAARGRYRRRVGRGLPFGISIRRADLADAMLDALDDDATVGATISVAA